MGDWIRLQTPQSFTRLSREVVKWKYKDIWYVVFFKERQSELECCFGENETNAYFEFLKCILKFHAET